MPRNANAFDGTRYIVPSGPAGRCITRLSLMLSAVCAVALSGATITGAEQGGPPVRQAPYTVSLTPRPVEHLSSGSNLAYGAMNELRAKYDANTEWLFSSFGSDAPGTFNILQYDPWIANNVGGANFTALYNDGSAEVHTDYNWVQIAHFHNWGTFGSGDRVDTTFANSPFYSNYTASKLPTLQTAKGKPGSGEIWLNGTNYPKQKIQNPTGGGNVPAGDLLFNDQPDCSLKCADNKDGTAWAYFDTFLVTFTWNGKFGQKAGGNVELMDGMRWGVEITKDPTPFDDPGKTPELSTTLLFLTGQLCLAIVFLFRGRTRKALT